MPDSSGATVLDDLPESIIVEEILVRLPLKDVIRCRAVRQAWRGATSTHKFMLDNCRRQPFLPVIYLYRECRCGCYAKENGSVNRRYFVFRDAGAGGPKLWPVLRYVTYNKNFVAVHGACDGLLLVSCKPPATSMVYWVSTGDEHGLPAAYYILSLGSNQRCIGQPSVLKASVRGLPSSVTHAPVMHRGGLHWDLGQLYDDVVTDILVLDTATEAFRVMHRPAELGYWPCLLQMDGALALCSRVDCYIFDVWVMHDDEAEIWSFRRRIHLSGIHESLSLGPMIAVVNDSELLIWLDQLLLHCDIDGKNMGYVESEEEKGGPPSFALTSHLFQESIAPFPLPNMQEDGASDEPPFILQAPFIPVP